MTETTKLRRGGGRRFHDAEITVCARGDVVKLGPEDHTVKKDGQVRLKLTRDDVEEHYLFPTKYELYDSFRREDESTRELRRQVVGLKAALKAVTARLERLEKP